MKKLAIISTHPIQYNAPWFKLLSQRGVVQCKVFYTWEQSQMGAKYDPDFGKTIEWDIPLLEGYDYTFVQNIAKEPGSHHFRGIDNPTLIKEIREWGAEVVLIIGWAYKSHLKCLHYFKGKVPILFRGDSTLLDESKGMKVLLRRIFLRWVYSYVDKALYVGTNNKTYFQAHGLTETQLIPAWHAIDNDRFFSGPEKRGNLLEKLRSQLAIQPNHFIILFAGKLEQKKNPFFLLELAKQIADPEVIFLITGNGKLEKELKAQSSADKRIRFLDFQNQGSMPVVYSLSNVFILPSNGPEETWGLAANEAMASGLPVILSSKVGGAVDLINNNGIIFNNNAVIKVKDYIEKIKQDPLEYRAASQASLDQIKKFNFLQIAEAVEKACK